jgi:hypothetical protein
MTVLQATMKLAVRTNHILLGGVVVDGFFLVFFGHPCWGILTDWRVFDQSVKIVLGDKRRLCNRGVTGHSEEEEGAQWETS